MKKSLKKVKKNLSNSFRRKKGPAADAVSVEGELAPSEADTTAASDVESAVEDAAPVDAEVAAEVEVNAAAEPEVEEPAADTTTAEETAPAEDEQPGRLIWSKGCLHGTSVPAGTRTKFSSICGMHQAGTQMEPN